MQHKAIAQELNAKIDKINDVLSLSLSLYEGHMLLS